MFYGYYKKIWDTRKTKVHIFRSNGTSLCNADFYRSAMREFVNLGDIDRPKKNISPSDICGNCERCI